MTSWLDALRDRGLQAKQATAQDYAVAEITRPKPVKAKPEPQFVWIQIRAPRNAADLGEIAPAFYTVDDGLLVMTDETGKPTGAEYRLLPDDDPRRIAARLAQEDRRKTVGEGNFNRSLAYGPAGVA